MRRGIVRRELADARRRAGTADRLARALQECKVTLWKNFSSFTPGTNFRAWARTIALHQVLNYRRSEQRRPWSAADQAFIESIAGEIERRGDQLERQIDGLRACLRKLPEPHRAIVLSRYYADRSVDEIALQSGRTTEAVYRLLSRIRAMLNECIHRQLASASRTP
jgi:RNA polymerase sigma-70 factor (ECF subfamily)